MDERLSLKAVDDYSDDYSSKVTASFFANHERISGQEILTVSTVQQVNVFIIRELMHAWKHEGQKLRSPYFDYTHPEVADALTKFQNLLSNHISISKENFQPLLKKAVSRTIYLIVDPYDFYSDTLDKQGSGMVQTRELKNEIKYLKINRPPLERLVERLEEKKMDEIGGNEAFGLLDQILEEVNFTPEDPDGFLAQFSTIVPLSMERLYEKKAEPKKPEPVLSPPPVVSPPPAPVVRQAEIPLRVEPRQEMRREAPAAVASAGGLGKIHRIKESLSINQKFMFTKILFSGDFEIFSEAIDRIDSLDNLRQAMSYIEQNFAEWDKESEEYEEFMELVQRRFV